ncbi:hypothetical protein O7599_14770 [Streptomyces sp. WMMC500]|uniref:hypothetical protein n=1 Tax=Streptomyces sp. WMMC500 TaxID=3015154 RepID=UPI00248AE871|nr:hypothetical protein [Streptomyces sp. WMMC500]WBB63699.1 hypothetical protein O7599_14770 [Streptomyces sp. WMMC500]
MAPEEDEQRPAVGVAELLAACAAAEAVSTPPPLRREAPEPAGDAPTAPEQHAA